MVTHVEDVDTSSAAASDAALFHLIERLADNKYWLGRRYAEWCTGAPTLESAVAAAAMAQDEVGHARSHYPLLRQFTGVDVEPEARAVFKVMACLDSPFKNWSDFVAANFIVDTAISVLYEASTESSYDDLRNRARRILGEEAVHWLHGKGWVRRLSRETGTRDQLQAALTRTWLHALVFYGPPGDPEMHAMKVGGIIASSPDELRFAFLERVGPVLDEAGMATRPPAGPLPWERWEHERYRLRDEVEAP